MHMQLDMQAPNAVVTYEGHARNPAKIGMTLYVDEVGQSHVFTVHV
jgi:hypothetical protein